MGFQITAAVGRNALNEPLDVIAIGTALATVGPDNGGTFAPPLTIDGLIEAIIGFQTVQALLPQPDGRVDPGGGTLRRLNAIAFPDEIGLRALDPGLPTSVDKVTWTPDEASLASDFVFNWVSTAGQGRISFFQLDESIVPRWFGVLVPDGTVNFDRLHIFFHPTPAQAGHPDSEYQTLGSFKDIFHYLTDDMSAQFCAAATGRILLMPLMTQGSSGDCGVFPQRWPEIAGCVLGRLAVGLDQNAPFQPVTDLVVSSFSSGITYSHHFRRRANLGTRLAGVIDFDGVISSFSDLSNSLTGDVVKAQQSPVSPATVSTLASQNLLAVPQPRWGGPWASAFDPNPATALLQIHGSIPQTMMFPAARRAG